MKSNFKILLMLCSLVWMGEVLPAVEAPTVQSQDFDPRTEKKKFDQQIKGFVQENVSIPVNDVNSASVKIDNKAIVIDGYWEFKDPSGLVLKEPVIVSQPAELNGQFVFALRAPGTSYVEIMEDGVKKVYRVEVFSRFKENSIEKELETAILEFVGDPGLKIKILPPQSALVGANLNRSFGNETSSEILAPRGETNSSATGQLLTSADFRPTIVLMGELENELVADKAVSIAGSYTTNVVNLTSIRNYLQVKIKVKVIKVDQTEDTTIGINYRNNDITRVDGTSGTGFGLGFTSAAPFFETVGSSSLPIFGNPVIPNITANVNLSKINGKATLLQEPTLTVLNGQPAEFNVGSLVPFSTTFRDASGLITTTTEFRQIGVTLRILPLVAEERTARTSVEGTIPFSGQTHVRTGVSTSPSGGGGEGGSIGGSANDLIRTIDENGVLKMVVQPSITNFGAIVGGQQTFDTNQVETRVAIRSGQSLVIGGLFTDSMRKDMEAVPFVEKIPIIGELFKNRSNAKSKSELIFVLQPEVLGLKTWARDPIMDNAPSYETDTQNYSIVSPDIEKTLVDAKVRQSKAKPVRISAGNVTPRTVSIIERAPADFPPIATEKLAPADKTPSTTLSIRPEESSEATPNIELAPEAPKPE